MTTTDPQAPTPAALGYRMPAEWAPHDATWLSWPHNRDTWPGQFDRVEPAMVEVAAALAASEALRVNVLDEAHGRHVAKLLASRVPPERLHLHVLPTNDAWIRDHGAIFVTRESGPDPLLALDFDYNAWGGKYPPFDRDREIARGMAEALGVPRRAFDAILEGGSIDVNGAGVLLTTEQCLLNPNRNPGLDRAEIEQLLAATLGVEQIIWLGDGIIGDDTDGHVDDLTRFVAEDTVVTVIEPRAGDPNHAPLAANRERLAGVRLRDSRPLRVIELPMPEPVVNGDERLPASYANFYVANEAVLLPVFGCAADGEAREILAGCFPGRRIVPVDCRVLVAGLGAIHCLTQQVPSAPTSAHGSR
jgi:agmatine deiminase